MPDMGRQTTPCETYLWSFGYPIPCKRVEEHPDEPGAHHYDTTPPLPGHPLYVTPPARKPS